MQAGNFGNLPRFLDQEHRQSRGHATKGPTGGIAAPLRMAGLHDGIAHLGEQPQHPSWRDLQRLCQRRRAAGAPANFLL